MRCTRVHDNYGVNVYKIKRWYILNEQGAMTTFVAKICLLYTSDAADE